LICKSLPIFENCFVEYRDYEEDGEKEDAKDGSKSGTHSKTRIGQRSRVQTLG
jgi:hypothetical protein